MQHGGNDQSWKAMTPQINNSNVKVAFVFDAGLWRGGRNYLRSLLAAIRAVPGSSVTPVVFTDLRSEDLSREFPGICVVRTSILTRRKPASMVREAIRRLTSQNLVLHWLLKRHGVTVLSHSDYLVSRSSIPTVAWIADFQHVHFPEFFSPEERRRRDRHFMDVLAHCDRVIVSSECASEDLKRFAPKYAHKAAVLRFVATPVPIGDAASLPDLQGIYNFHGPYFLLPNQFWVHKNHRVVIHALQILRQQGRSVTVLTTGATDDFRSPGYFASLMEYAKQCDVLETFRVLGQVPYDHLVGLMYHAIAFINPSRFEGWSTSVEEAKSMGKQIILSDIPIHREQAPERGTFFSATDPDALAAALVRVSSNFDKPMDLAMQELAREQFPGRQIEFGQSYLRIVRDVL